MFVYIRHPYFLFLHLNFSRKPHWTNYNFNKQFKKQRWWNISVNATLTQRKEEGATKKREKPVRRLWGSIKKLNLNSGESEAGDEKKSVRRRFRSWRCCQTLRKEESAIKKSRQSDQISEEEVKLWRREFQKKDKKSVFSITLSLCPLLTPLCSPKSQSPRKNNANFSEHFKIAINYFYL